MVRARERERQDRERHHIVGDGQIDRWHIHPRFVDFPVGELLIPTLVREPAWLKLFTSMSFYENLLQGVDDLISMAREALSGSL